MSQQRRDGDDNDSGISPWLQGRLLDVYQADAASLQGILTDKTHTLPKGWCFTTSSARHGGRILHKKMCGARMRPDDLVALAYTSPEDLQRLCQSTTPPNKLCARPGCQGLFTTEWGAGAGAASAAAAAVTGALGAFAGAVARSAARTASRRLASAAIRSLTQRLRPK